MIRSSRGLDRAAARERRRRDRRGADVVDELQERSADVAIDDALVAIVEDVLEQLAVDGDQEGIDGAVSCVGTGARPRISARVRETHGVASTSTRIRRRSG